VDEARAIAARMGLDFEFKQTGYGTLQSTLTAAVARNELGPNEKAVAWLR
jgi:hypothetical protein